METKTLKIDVVLHEKLKDLSDKSGKSLQYMAEIQLEKLISNDTDININFDNIYEENDKLILSLDSTNVEKLKIIFNKLICSGTLNIKEIENLIENRNKLKITPNHELYFKVKNFDTVYTESLLNLTNKKLKSAYLGGNIELLHIDNTECYFKITFNNSHKFTSLFNDDILKIVNSTYYDLFKGNAEDNVILNIKYGEQEIHYVDFTVNLHDNYIFEENIYEFIKYENRNINIILVRASKDKIQYKIQYSNKFDSDIKSFIIDCFKLLARGSKITYPFTYNDINLNDKINVDFLNIFEDECRAKLYKKLYEDVPEVTY